MASVQPSSLTTSLPPLQSPAIPSTLTYLHLSARTLLCLAQHFLLQTVAMTSMSPVTPLMRVFASSERHFGTLLTGCIVNVLRGRLWDDESEFDKEKEKDGFRDYESACDRVKLFYKEQHGNDILLIWCTPGTHSAYRKTDSCLQYQGPCRI